MLNPTKKKILEALDELIAVGFQDELVLITLDSRSLGYHSVRNLKWYIENSPAYNGLLDALYLKNKVYEVDGFNYIISLYFKSDKMQLADLLIADNRMLLHRDSAPERDADYMKNLRDYFGIDGKSQEPCEDIHEKWHEEISDARQSQERIVRQAEEECRRRRNKSAGGGLIERIRRWLKGDVQYKK